jgi:hypothetical protein
MADDLKVGKEISFFFYDDLESAKKKNLKEFRLR